MSRRASSSTNPLWLFLAFILVAGFIGGGYWVYSQVSDPFRTLAALPVPAYLDNSDGLRGNVYRVKATVANQLAWSPADGRLYSVEIEDTGDVLALMIPAEFNSVNLQKGQHFNFEVEVADHGILRARNLRKS